MPLCFYTSKVFYREGVITINCRDSLIQNILRVKDFKYTHMNNLVKNFST